MTPDRTFKAEHKRLRGLLRAEGRDPYTPAAPFVPVGVRYRLWKAKQRPLTASQIADMFLHATQAPRPHTRRTIESALFRALR